MSNVSNFPTAVPYSGPVCVKCTHHEKREDVRDWVCKAREPQVVRPAEINPITGEEHPPRHRRIRCIDENNRGQCQLFSAVEAPGEG